LTNQHRVRLTFGIHDHQPVGNFAHVFEEAFAKCYAPFLDILGRHPKIKASLHHSGCLLEWIEEHRPEYLDRLAALAESGQVEILGGGFYEPILSAVPHDDALEQLARMNRWARERLGAKVRGIWLTERIWEPALPTLLRAAGVEFTIADETHFRFAGVPKEKIAGYYITERNGETTAVFPIDRVLRYKIPFDTAEKIVHYLREMKNRFQAPVATYADDGEKFGLWPDTYEWVYEKKWLEKFFTALEEADDIATAHFAEILDSELPTGRIYLPTASYHEMTEWALPVDAGLELAKLHQDAKRDGTWERMMPFVRGGFWDNFLGKYQEANRLHKRMIRASKKSRAALQQAPDHPAAAAARTHALRAQCNCAYWHGMFGGLYLNYLRDGVAREMYRSENLADEILGLPTLEVVDHDADGAAEAVIDTRHMSVVIKPSYGGSIYEFVDRRTGHALTDVLTRRREIYHDKITQAPVETGQPKSIHDIVRVKEEGLAEMLFYDWYTRYSALDHFLAPWSDAAGFATTRYGELSDFVNQPFKLLSAKRKGKTFVVEVEREGGLYPGGVKHPVVLRKRFVVAADEPWMEVETTVVNRGEAMDFWLVRQWNVTLLAADAPDRWLEIDGVRQRMNQSGVHERVDRVRLGDEWKNLTADFAGGEPCELWHFPVETVSQSEGGFERTYQGTALAFGNRFHLKNEGTKRLALTVTLGSVR
jgi:alpha-amylase